MQKIIALILCLMLTNLAVATMPTMADDPHSVYGYLYIDGIIAPSGVEVKLSFPGEDVTDITSETGYYQIDFMGHEWETGYFYVYYNGFWYVPVDNQSVEIEPDIISYNIDLHINTSSPPDTVYVDDDYDPSTPGWGYDHFDSIQDGVDAVDEGGTVYVFNGTYYENIVVDKTLNLVGEDRNNSIIDGRGGGHAVTVYSDFITLDGFTIKASPASGVVIYNGEGCCISTNIFEYCSHGIALHESCNNIIQNNSVSDSATGISLKDSSDNNMIKNNVLNSNNFGISLYHGVSASSCYNKIINNVISNNSHIGINLEEESDYNTIYHNNFINNTQNAYDECNNIWNDTYPSGGNYWDDYSGVDENDDGIGDTPYDLPGEYATDYYPLMNPWDENPPIANFTYEINGMTVTFNPFSSYDRDGFITAMGWCFGDDPYYVEGPPKIVNHTYEQPGTYNVSLKVIDDDGLYDWMTIQIEIEAEYEFVTTLLIGRITNLDTEEDIITFEAVNLRAITFSPFSFNPYTSGEIVTISKDYFGLVGARFVIALCDAVMEET